MTLKYAAHIDKEIQKFGSFNSGHLTKVSTGRETAQWFCNDWCFVQGFVVMRNVEPRMFRAG